MPPKRTHDEIYLHINWHCHEDRPMINPQIEELLWSFIENYCKKLKGVYFKGIGGTDTHIHLAIQVQAYVTPSEIIGKIKGASAREINKRFGQNTIHWQTGYGIVSFAKRNLPAVLKYIANQKQHHKSGEIKEALERHGAE